MPLSIIIVNYHSAELIEQCLNSLNTAKSVSTTEVLIVDNSSDGTGRIAFLKRFPGIKWIDMGYNAGFARANNAGMKAAKGDMFLLLNPDTFAIDDSVERCYQQLKESQYIAAGVQLLDEQRVPQISGSRFLKGGLNHLLPIPYLGSFIRWLGYKVKSKVPNVQQAKEVEEVDWISGAFLMVKREGVEKAGFMDEDFFLYAEEVEWCSRLRKAGLLCLFGNLNMVHLEGTTINKSQNLEEKGYYNLYDKKGLQLMVSNHVRVRKQYGIGWFLFLLLNYSWGVLLFFVAGTLHDSIKLKNPALQWKKATAFARNVIRIWVLCPTIIRNKPHFYKML
jgi:GT2 family glycosyltransferase